MIGCNCNDCKYLKNYYWCEIKEKYLTIFRCCRDFEEK